MLSYIHCLSCYTWYAACVSHGTRWIFKYNSGYSYIFTRLTNTQKYSHYIFYFFLHILKRCYLRSHGNGVLDLHTDTNVCGKLCLQISQGLLKQANQCNLMESSPVQTSIPCLYNVLESLHLECASISILSSTDGGLLHGCTVHW
jgi:hypothetical protein